jgi:hypothetical protein
MKLKHVLVLFASPDLAKRESQPGTTGSMTRRQGLSVREAARTEALRESGGGDPEREGPKPGIEPEDAAASPARCRPGQPPSGASIQGSVLKADGPVLR